MSGENNEVHSGGQSPTHKGEPKDWGAKPKDGGQSPRTEHFSDPSLLLDSFNSRIKSI